MIASFRLLGVDVTIWARFGAASRKFLLGLDVLDCVLAGCLLVPRTAAGDTELVVAVWAHYLLAFASFVDAAVLGVEIVAAALVQTWHRAFVAADALHRSFMLPLVPFVFAKNVLDSGTVDCAIAFEGAG